MTLEQGVRAAPVWQVGVPVQALALEAHPLQSGLHQVAFCTTPLIHSALHRKLCCRGTETSVTSSSTHISSPSSDPNHPYPSTAAPLCLWLTVSAPAKTCHPSLLREFVQRNPT